LSRRFRSVLCPSKAPTVEPPRQPWLTSRLLEVALVRTLDLWGASHRHLRIPQGTLPLELRVLCSAKRCPGGRDGNDRPLERFPLLGVWGIE
jgi:hypothetical protein